MERTVVHGLAVGMIDPDELADAPWLTSTNDVELVRMIDPPRRMWPALREAGFICKPSALTWLLALGAGEDTVLARLSKSTRNELRRARKRAEQAGLHEVVEQPLGAASLDAFLSLYQVQIEQMRTGVPHALRKRELILQNPLEYFAVLTYKDDSLVGGCLCQECPDESAVRIRFSAVDETSRSFSLAKALYFSAMRVARAKGYTWMTLGNDTNLYGHTCQPGLFHSKASLGFHAVPSQDFLDHGGVDEADLVLRLATLADPTLVLGYPNDDDRALSAHLLTSSATIEHRPYHAPFLSGMTVHQV